MRENIPGGDTSRRSFLKGLGVISTAAALPKMVGQLVGEVSAQEAVSPPSYEKQEPKVPSAEKIDEMVRAYAQECDPSGASPSIDVLIRRIFADIDEQAGVKAFGDLEDGIDIDLKILINRARSRGKDTGTIEQIHTQLHDIATIANEAYIALVSSIPEYVNRIQLRLDTRSEASRMHENAIAITRANDVLLPAYDQIRKVMKR